MPMQLTSDDRGRIDHIISTCSQVLQAAHNWYASEEAINPEVIEEVCRVRDRLGCLLAQFEDGAGYGMVSDEIIRQLHIYEEMASSLSQAIKPS